MAKCKALTGSAVKGLNDHTWNVSSWADAPVVDKEQMLQVCRTQLLPA